MNSEEKEPKNAQTENNKKEQKAQNEQKGFFKKIWYSITKIEKYPEMAVEGVGRALSYMAKLVAILAIVLSIWMTYRTYEMVNTGIDYLENEFPNFTYKDGILQLESSEQPLIIESEQFGKIIIDTNTDSEEKINEYTNSISEYSSGIVFTKEKASLKNGTVAGTVSYNYKDIFSGMNITELNKQDIINYANSKQVMTLYISVFITLFMYSFIMYFITTIWYVAIISILGLLVTVILKMRMRYVAIFNMSVYAVTLSVILNIIYLIVNIFTNFVIQYFQVMYIAVATIYLIAAILIMKSELIKKQAELMKIIEAQKIVRKETEIDNNEEKSPDEKKKEEEKDKEKKEEKGKKKKSQKGNLDEPEGTNA